MSAMVLVEGVSDRVAVETLAARRGRDLGAEGIQVGPIGGAQAIGRVLRGLDGGVRVAGLCDAGEEPAFRRALERAGLGVDLTRADMEALGFYVCEADLEDELIRAVGVETIERKQAAWQGRDTRDQLRRWLGSGGRRKIRYARLLVDALDPSRVPRPLDGVLAHV
jgi:hypothetical protein